MFLDKAKDIYSNAHIDIGDHSRMRVHILECIAAMLVFHMQSASSKKEMEKIVHNSFFDVITEITTRRNSTQLEPAIDMLIDAISESKVWLPVHCMAASRNSQDVELEIIEREIEMLSNRDKAVGPMKVNPLHLAAANRDPNIAIVSQLLTCSIRLARVKDRDGNLPLHYAAQYSNSVKLLQELLQAYPNGATVKNKKGETFLHKLCQSRYAEASDMLRMVLAAVPNVAKIQSDNDNDNDDEEEDEDDVYFEGNLPLHEVINNHNRACIIDDYEHIPPSTRIDMILQLIAVYPESLTVQNEWGNTPLHELVQCGFTSDTPVLDMMLEKYPGAASIANQDNKLPLHSVSLLEHAYRLVAVYPEALSVNAGSYGTPLHCYSGDCLELFHYLYSCRPASMFELTRSWGRRVLHNICSYPSNLVMLRAVYELDPSAISAVENTLRWTPLHQFISTTFANRDFNLYRDGYARKCLDMLYFLIKMYPNAASIPDKSSKTPYSLCHVNQTHARRLLLRAAPALDPETLRELNYSARRMALFLFFLGSREDCRKSLFIMLSTSPSSQSLVRRVIEFL